MTEEEIFNWMKAESVAEAAALAGAAAERERIRLRDLNSAEAKPEGTSRINPEYGFCRACGWPVVFACCNDGMGTEPPYAGYDYWSYCSNKTCANHAGEGHYSGSEGPEFIRSY